MSLRQSTYLVSACLACAALGWVFTANHRGGGAIVDPRDKAATMPDPRGRTLFPEATCVPPARLAKEGASPRCVVSFARVLTAVGLAPGGSLAITALAHAATVAWNLPSATSVLLFDPLPAEAE